VSRQLRVGPGAELEFEELFAERWPRLLQRSAGYVRTELEVLVGLEVRVTDVWKSHYEFEAFLEQQREELKRFQETVRAYGIVVKETQLGAYYGPGDDLDDGTLAPA
jgi:hypothetical protein